MKFLQNWQDVLKRAWSLRFMAVALILSVVNGWLVFVMGQHPPMWVYLVHPAVELLAMFARLVAQKNLTEFIKDTAGSVRKNVIVPAALAAAVMGAAVPMVEKWEGYKAEAYQDVVGVWTIGFGETEGVRPGDVTTLDAARAQLLDRLLNDYYLPVVACAPELTQAPVPVQASVASWTYNVGVGAACKSTLIRYVRAGDYRAACDQLPRWNRAGGRVWQGLTNRRVDERGLCLSGL